MAEWHIGQKVVCIDDAGLGYPEDSHLRSLTTCPRVGGIYTVRSVFIDPCRNEVVLRLCEITNPALPWQGGRFGKYEQGFYAYRFRPLVNQDTDISVFHDILANLPKRIPADA